MREFLASRVVDGGAIPKGTQLRDHLLDAYVLEKEELKKKIKDKNFFTKNYCAIRIIRT